MLHLVARSSVPLSNEIRLPRHAKPSHYDIRLELDLEALRFDGTVGIDFEVSEATESLVLNAAELDLHQTAVTGADGRIQINTLTQDEDLERVELSLGSPIGPGRYQLHIRYSGIINDQLEGLYVSRYRDTGGTEHLIATSQCQSTHARRILPCWDEPDFKATFQTTMVVPSGLMALSNTREVERTTLENGREEFVFAPTMKMSPYLLAFITGPFEATESVAVKGTPTRIVVPKGSLDLAELALEHAIFCFEYLSDYYGIPYPGDKLDHVAIPDFAAGAMENVGLITYRETYLVIDEQTASHGELQASLDTIGHEIAHQWFGNLVTMAWWEGAWLNEAFASFMELKATDAMHPEWKRWLAFADVEIPWAMATDQLLTTRPIEYEVTKPSDVEDMFDAITYGKGPAVLRMMETFIGEDQFRQGVGSYLRDHSFGNTVTTDLWKGLDSVADWPASEIMKTWVYQRGFPQVDVRRSGVGIVVRQRRYLAVPSDDDSIWRIPLQLRGRIQGKPFERRVLLDGVEKTLEFEDGVDWLVANAGGHGFYRTSYSGDLFEALLGNLGELDAIERLFVVSDTLAFIRNGEREAGRFLDLVRGFGDETEQAIWSVIISGLGLIEHHALDDGVARRFEDLVRDLLGPALDHLGWEPTDAESDLDRKLRGSLIRGMGTLGNDKEVIERAAGITSQMLSDDPVDPEVASASLSVYAHHGGRGEYDILWRAYQESNAPLEKRRLLRSVASVQEEELALDTLHRAIRGEIRGQDVFWVFTRLLSGDAGPAVWRRARSRWGDLLASMPGTTRLRAIDGLPALSQPEVAEDVKSFFAVNPLEEAERSLSQKLERLTANVLFRERETPRVTAYFT